MNTFKERPTMADVLKSDDKLVMRSENLLTRLFRTILLDSNIGPRQFQACVTRYLHDPNTGIEDTPTARNNHRGNMMKELGSNDMTWKNFVKALQVLGVENYEFILNIERRGKITQHIARASNNIVYEEDKLDLSNAKVVDGFISDNVEQSPEITTPVAVLPPVKAATTIEGLAKS